MKKLSFALCALMAMPAMAQKYTVSGTVPAGVKKVYLQHIGTAMRPDSVEVKNGTFRFEGEANGNLFGFAIADKEQRLSVMLDGDVKVDFSKESVSGSAENEGLNKWEKLMSEPSAQYNAVMREYYGYRRQGKEIPDSVMARIERVAEDRKSVV